MIRNLCVIPARQTSTRFPRKIFAKVAGKQVIQRVIERASQAVTVDEVCLAIPDNKGNRELRDYCDKWKIRYHASKLDENNVLGRIAETAHIYSPETIVRVNCDSPMILPDFIDQAVLEMRTLNKKKKRVDYVGYKFKDTPTVLTNYAAPEVFTYHILKMWESAIEHVSVAAYTEMRSAWISLDGEPFCTTIDKEEDIKRVEFWMTESGSAQST
jgi:spore coat polysaccharide biosynthesis protein SpsF (cytidylyltransferase family)